ncbi:hypothetical protein ACFWBS_58125 [Streptomyces mirabilis]|uniref:hypothetical protein n=1 Tax=Streptomyces mirabilis TaxID=68239 RepID=UPI003666A750
MATARTGGGKYDPDDMRRTGGGVRMPEVGFVRRIGVEPHLTSRLVRVVPEVERPVEVAA